MATRTSTHPYYYAEGIAARVHIAKRRPREGRLLLSEGLKACFSVCEQNSIAAKALRLGYERRSSSIPLGCLFIEKTL